GSGLGRDVSVRLRSPLHVRRRNGSGHDDRGRLAQRRTLGDSRSEGESGIPDRGATLPDPTNPGRKPGDTRVSLATHDPRAPTPGPLLPRRLPPPRPPPRPHPAPRPVAP